MLAALAGLIALAAAGFCWSRNRAAAAWRAGLLSDGTRLLRAARLGRDRAGFATLDGRFGAFEARLRLIPEALVFRRLPQLWLSVTLRAPLPAGMTLDVLRRPAGAEFYAPDDLPARFPAPPGWPADTLVRGTRGAEALLARAAPALDTILADPRVKEVLLTPKGLRLVLQASEGTRGAYLLLRGIRFPLKRIPPETLCLGLEAARDLALVLSEPPDARLAA